MSFFATYLRSRTRKIFLYSFIYFLALNCFCFGANAKTERYQGVAKIDDKIVYTEKHVVEFDEKGGVISAETTYVDAADKTIATLSSQFRKSLTSPDHDYVDLRTGEKHGIRNVAGRIELYRQEKGKKEETKLFPGKPAEGSLIVGCQGLHYYMRDRLEEMKNRKIVPITMLIPGSLDSYEFVLKYLKESEDMMEFDIEIKNWFLKLFAPKLSIRYNKKLKTLTWYQGLSNVPDEKGKLQNVTITYSYENETK